MQRISVVGTSGSGKSTLARRIATALDLPYVELDAIHHLPNWTPMEPERFVEEVARVAAGDRWVVDGNYRRVSMDGPLWPAADSVVWLDLPRHVIMRQIIGRSVRRSWRREELWSGNRESFRNLLRLNPERNVVLWAWTTVGKNRTRYAAALTDPRFAHLQFVRLRSHAEAESFLSGLQTRADDPAR